MRIFVRATPNSKNERVVKNDDTHFSVYVSEPPRQGMANRAIAAALADFFGVSKSSVQLVSGFTSREKVFDIIQ
ncbi:MAG: hypothetical protein COU07_00730 [Candidatus Harrisonbacteria bacterium CG10_big_fil_rev_8_21_14_0_10_40_38]|uniref:Uncharacterized protein n=1 Tax=Candidatus Harrisonbacteria bacterium CG10_big_fil_rev_8_21_14_0_10_40_38 TaxID=1974583 RepID=A0A2H0USL4_9BACT|nr:MAG: hypothetical protein COU07_00730 [Candidatus Harrisonbacteria bacterium CG10_big_fil_rev_8_21_14_0_10_40_38]